MTILYWYHRFQLLVKNLIERGKCRLTYYHIVIQFTTLLRALRPMSASKKGAKGGKAAPKPAAEPKQIASEGPEVDERKLKIRAAFAIFDPEATGTVSEEEVPTIFRYLDVFVADKEYTDKLLPELQGDEPTSFVRYERFEKICISLMDSHAYEPDPEARNSLVLVAS
jgi:hypothetical protein